MKTHDVKSVTLEYAKCVVVDLIAVSPMAI
jgi:hypothetical protein